MDRARVWSLPETPPLLVGAAVSAETARLVGTWADGLITVARPVHALRPVVDAFRRPAVTASRSPSRRICRGPTTRRRRSPSPTISGARGCSDRISRNLELPNQFDDATRFVRPDDVCGPVMVAADPGRYVAWIHELMELEPESIYLHHVGTDQDRFIDAFGEHVLPEVAP